MQGRIRLLALARLLVSMQAAACIRSTVEEETQTARNSAQREIVAMEMQKQESR